MAKKILVVGDWHSSIHEQPFSEGLSKNGLIVEKFKWYLYFDEFSGKGRLAAILSRIQDKYMFGFLVNRLNQDLISIVAKLQPDILFIYRGSHIYSKTLLAIKSSFPNIYLIGYNNDDPFSKLYPKWKWRHFNQSIPLYHLILAYRHSNIIQYQNKGAHQVDILRSWYLPWIHSKVSLDKLLHSPYTCDVIFIGHFENDGRIDILDFLASKQISIKIFGPTGSTKKSGWDEAIKHSIYLTNHAVTYLKGEDYVLAINSAKIALCFLSKLNNDTYTRRCFEIPACGTALFCEYSDDLANLFEDGVSIVLFRDKEELLTKISYYLSHPAELKIIAENGYQLMHEAGHDVYSRAAWLVNKYSLLSEPGKLNPNCN
ncbi:MAG: hypothetical protein EBX50_15990 [Chitinophagia bacterium]|nr:hypothetical protein [Chitinophagia bacterium]